MHRINGLKTDAAAQVSRQGSVQTTHQESRGAIQETSDPGDETSVEKAGELGRNSSCLHRVKLAADYKLLT